jgi:Mitochondrial import receptor subunit Tom6, fungal
MNKRILWVTLLPAVFIAGVATAQYPIMDMIANKVIQKYQSSSCEQLWENRGKHGPEEQRAVAMLRDDPQMRQAFINQVAGPVVNKMFECGMVP